jgi:RNA polymerase sigma-70 factor, ECF subfamily
MRPPLLALPYRPARVRIGRRGWSNQGLRDLDRTSYEHAVRAYSADLYRYAWWLCRDRHLAEDVVQETFARAWKSWTELRDVALAKAWLMTILRNELARAFSRSKPTVDLDAVAEGELPALPSFESQLETAELVSLLPETYREPLLLQVLGGFSCAEIAGMLGTTEGAVMTRLTRARQAMRRQYEPTAQKRASK